MPVLGNPGRGATHDENMAGQVESSESAKADGSKAHEFKLRPYQLEMLEESMRRNIIVAMDTGSGKTFIAVSRIEKELERCSPEKFVWFLAPTVALANQQHDVISTQLPVFQTRFLSGADGVDCWNEQIWDEVLAGIKIVVSTHQVLLDALVHGFVGMAKLALLVFDEAHHARADHPASRIMRDFYHPYASAISEDAPAVLGLTASPVINSQARGLQDLEENLQAISRTPKLHREEMLRYVIRPDLIKMEYLTNPASPMSCRELVSLRRLCTDIDIEQDPYVIKLRSNPATRDTRELRKALTTRKTYCMDQLRKLYSKALTILTELGAWSLQFYMRACIQKFVAGASSGSIGFDAIDDAEKIYLKDLFARIEISADSAAPHKDNLNLTPKVQCLIDFLVDEHNENFIGLVFVQTRVEVAILAQLLSRHVQTKERLIVSTFVGASTSSNRKFEIGELVDVKNQKNTLDDLRNGRSNLVITTTALEEGIDVSACNAVVCFERPQVMNLKSFIQRRGRARKSSSKFVLMFEEGSYCTVLSAWQQLETEMIETYMDDMRCLQQIQGLEAIEEGDREFCVESTGAKITIRDAVQHLYHFCATLPADPYVDSVPLFIFSESVVDGAITAKVILPNSVHASVREAYSQSRWKTEKFARRDAAFEAYVALFRAGLVSDHLLPIRGTDEAAIDAHSAVEKIASLVEVPEQLDAWAEIGQEWQKAESIYTSAIVIDHNGEALSEMEMLLPRALPSIPNFELHWDYGLSFTAMISMSSPTPLHQDYIASAAQATGLLLSSIYQSRMDAGRFDFTALFLAPDIRDLEAWIEPFRGTRRADTLLDRIEASSNIGIVRDMNRYGTAHVFQDVLRTHFDASDDTAQCMIVANWERDPQTDYLKLKRLSKRADFLHELHPRVHEAVVVPGVKYIPASECEVDNLPFAYSRFALFIPSIMHQVEVGFVVENLCRTLLFSVQFKDLSLVMTATSAPAARERTDYQCMEFLGDSRLKLLTSMTLLAEYPHWHEGILSNKKDHIVSNAHLASAALRTNLAKWIRTKPFTGHKWKPPYFSNLSHDVVMTTRQVSTKTLADVVEALIGAAWLDGEEEKALACLKVFLPEIPWLPLSERLDSLSVVYDTNFQYPAHFEQLEELIDYTFTRKSLLVEALTHPSHHGPHSGASYQRLEFAGDSILDNIVTTIAYAHQPPVRTNTLHLIRTTLVNGPFLAFLCLTLSIPTTGSVDTSIWRFMRHASPNIGYAQQACLARYSTLGASISDALEQGTHYPWTLLARLDAPKFFSDIIESLLGAIYIDSRGSLPACEAFISRLGLMTYLRRALRGSVALLHPKLELGMLAGAEKVRYAVEKAEEGGEGGGRLSCSVWVGERELVKVGDGISVLEVQTRAAEEAGNILKGEKAKMAEKGDVKVEQAEKRSDTSGTDDEMNDVEESDGESMAYETANEW